MDLKRRLQTLATTVLCVAAISNVAEAQWSLLAPGDRSPAAGQNRYYMLVLANPVPGMENDFNDWYTNMMLGDLSQLPGFVGVQRFRIISDAGLDPRPTIAGYQKGYLAIWDQQGPDNAPIDQLMRDSLEGGKVSHGAGFDYRGFGTEGVGGSYQAMGPRITSGKKPWMPASTDLKTRRPSRYIVMDLSNPAVGKEDEFESAIGQHIKDVLSLPGWMAAQRFKVVSRNSNGRAGRTPTLQYLTVWELEAPSPQGPQNNPLRPGQSGKLVNEIQTVLTAATKTGKVKPLPVDEATWQFTYWEPITPYITRTDFDR